MGPCNALGLQFRTWISRRKAKQLAYIRQKPIWGAVLLQHAKICQPRGRLKSCLCLENKDLFATIALKSFLTYLISIASFLHQQ